MTVIDVMLGLELKRISAEITKIRLERKLSQRGLAKFAGISSACIERMEADLNYCCNLPNLIKICKALKIKPSEILTRAGL